MKYAFLRRTLLASALLFGALAQSGEAQAKRQARSVHLTYQDWPRAATILYNETTVEAAYPGSYFCVMAFNGGYGGIQLLPDGSPYLIFSVWDKGDAEKNAKAVQRVRHDYAGPGVEVARFGGEGTGGRAMAQWPWRVGQRVRYAVSTAPGEAGETAYTGWIWDEEKGAWFRIATFSSRVNSAKSLLTGCYSFVEDFLRNGESRNHTRKAAFGMLWSYGEQGWQVAGGGSFSGDANTLTTIDCGSAGADIWLQTGGETVQHTALNAKLKPEVAPDPAESAPYREALLTAVAAASNQWADALVLGGKRLSPWAAHKAGIPEEIAGVKVTRYQASDGLGARFTLEATCPKSVKTGPLTLLSALPDASLPGLPGRLMVRSQGRLYAITHPQAEAWLGEAALPMGSTDWNRQDCAIGSRVVGIGDAPAGATYRVTFTYRKGRDHLRIRSVRLLDGQGRTVVADEHAGKAGCAHEANIYTLTAPCDVPDAQILLSYGNREVPDSYGLITFEQLLPGYGFLGFPEGFTLAPGKPVTFALTSQPLSGEIEPRLDGLLPGDPGAPVEAKVTRQAGKLRLTLTAREALKVQTLDLAALPEGMVEPPATVESAAGRQTLTGPGARAERLADVAGLWTPQNITNMAQAFALGPVAQGERWQVAFHYLSGRVSVRPLWVDLIDDADHVAARDEHAGKAGYKREAADYFLTAPKAIKHALCFVRYDTQEGASTRGLIACTRQGQPGPVLLWAKPGTLKPGKAIIYELASQAMTADRGEVTAREVVLPAAPFRPLPAAGDKAWRTERVPGNPTAARLVDRSAVTWQVREREALGDGLYLETKVADFGPYRRWVYTLTADRVTPISRIRFFEDFQGADVSGNTDGAVGFTPERWFGIEHPMAKLRKRPLTESTWSEADYRALEQRLPLTGLTPGERLAVRFEWTSGAKRLDIASVALCAADGQVLAEDVHPGYTGLSREANVYTLTVPAGVTEATLLARYRHVDGYQSAGRIVVETDRPTAVDGWLERGFALEPGQRWSFSTVEGPYAPGQLRRSFQAYLEHERAHPYRVFPHYNSWFHLGIWTYENEDPLKRMTEAKCLAAIRDVCDPLRKRGVTLDSYLWDDGWDDWNSLWQYHKGFPNGFEPLVAAARERGGGIGAWLSPWGGYNRAAAMRRAYAKAIGLPTNEKGMSLAQPKYYAAFRDRCLQMIRDYGMNLFKFDGIGGGPWATGTDAKTAPDLQGLFSLIAELRAAKPDLFINCTVGTWPSPFWVLHADSIWRGGSDWGALPGEGHLRQRWISYRDDIIHKRFAAPCPLFPLNSMMMHGIIVTNIYGMPVSDKPEDTRAFADEVWMGIGCGTDLQEYYLNPEMMSEAWWDILASAIAWLRANEATLRDVHWVGGSPSAGEVYGYAAWSPAKSTLLLRNPAGKAQTFALDLPKLLELPAGAAAPKPVRVVYASSGRSLDALALAAGSVTLDPWETLLLELE
ncbi:MAG: DUF3472 domain-containing protein [Candidatus Spyradenecus sp.]